MLREPAVNAREEPHLDCFRCGQDDHLSRDCPNRTPRHAAPDPAPALTRAPSNRPEDKPIPPRRDESEIADPVIWATVIRERMGWSVGAREIMLRAMAARQVAESRAEERTRETFSQPHPDDFPGGLPLPGEYPTLSGLLPRTPCDTHPWGISWAS